MVYAQAMNAPSVSPASGHREEFTVEVAVASSNTGPIVSSGSSFPGTFGWGITNEDPNNSSMGSISPSAFDVYVNAVCSVKHPTE